jgi:HK97 gp10 family phage protein
VERVRLTEERLMAITSVKGIPQMEAKLRAILARVEASRPAATRAGAEVVAQNAQQGAPRLTGDLQASVGVEQQGSDAAAVARAPHARFQERGTSRHGAQPFMTPAAQASTGGIVAAMTAIFRSAIGR